MDTEINKMSGAFFNGLAITYASGFVVWNIHLSRFGYFEYELLQSRFISTGILFLLLPTIVYLFSFYKQNFSKKRMAASIAFVVLYFIIFTYILFPSIPQYLGGGKPYLGSIVANAETVKQYQKMGLLKSEISDIETTRGCKIYENKNILIFGFIKGAFENNKYSVSADRVLIINRDKIDAVSVLPQDDPGLIYQTASSTVTLSSQFEIRCVPILGSY